MTSTSSNSQTNDLKNIEENPSSPSPEIAFSFKNSERRFIIDREVEMLRKAELDGRRTSSPKRRINYDEMLSKSEGLFNKDKPMAGLTTRGRPTTSPKKREEIKVNVILQKPINQTARQYDDNDIAFHQGYQKVKQLANSNSAHINHVLKSIESAYIQNLDRPKTAKALVRPVSAYESGVTFGRAARSLKRDIEFIRSHKNRPLNHPQWDEQFVYAKSLTPPILAPVAPIHRIHDNFVRSMSKYSSLTESGKEMSTTDDSNRSPLTSPKAIASMMSTFENPINSNPGATLASTLNSGTQDVMSETIRETTASPTLEQYDSLSSEDNLSRAMKANELWTKLVSRLHSLGNEIQYSDIFELSILREPPPIVAIIFGYAAILMGLKPEWNTVRSTLLKESRIFLNFLREINPTEIPIRRVRKAQALNLADSISIGIESGERVCKSLPKIAQWVSAFQDVADALIRIDDSKETDDQGGHKKKRRHRKKTMADRLLQEDRSGDEHPRTRQFLRKLARDKELMEKLQPSSKKETPISADLANLLSELDDSDSQESKPKKTKKTVTSRKEEPEKKVVIGDDLANLLSELDESEEREAARSKPSKRMSQNSELYQSIDMVSLELGSNTNGSGSFVTRSRGDSMEDGQPKKKKSQLFYLEPQPQREIIPLKPNIRVLRKSQSPMPKKRKQRQSDTRKSSDSLDIASHAEVWILSPREDDGGPQEESVELPTEDLRDNALNNTGSQDDRQPFYRENFVVADDDEHAAPQGEKGPSEEDTKDSENALQLSDDLQNYVIATSSPLQSPQSGSKKEDLTEHVSALPSPKNEEAGDADADDEAEYYNDDDFIQDDDNSRVTFQANSSVVQESDGEQDSVAFNAGHSETGHQTALKELTSDEPEVSVSANKDHSSPPVSAEFTNQDGEPVAVPSSDAGIADEEAKVTTEEGEVTASASAEPLLSVAAEIAVEEKEKVPEVPPAREPDASQSSQAVEGPSNA
eukprot:scaffold4964_cov248-Ochromonas_danica.AAC.1